MTPYKLYLNGEYNLNGYTRGQSDCIHMTVFPSDLPWTLSIRILIMFQITSFALWVIWNAKMRRLYPPSPTDQWMNFWKSDDDSEKFLPRLWVIIRMTNKIWKVNQIRVFFLCRMFRSQRDGYSRSEIDLKIEKETNYIQNWYLFVFRGIFGWKVIVIGEWEPGI